MTKTKFHTKRNTIHNRDNPDHYMCIKAITRHIAITMNGHALAKSNRAIRLMEVGKDIYDPVIYLPKEDLIVKLQSVDTLTTHCPLKGDASYWTFKDAGHQAEHDWLAWSYETPFEFARQITGYIAFDASKTTLIESGEA